MPRRNHQTESFDKPNRALPEAKGTPLSVRILRSGSPERSASEPIFCRGHLWVHFRYGPVTRSPSQGCLSISFIRFVSSPDVIQATGR